MLTTVSRLPSVCGCGRRAARVRSPPRHSATVPLRLLTRGPSHQVQDVAAAAVDAHCPQTPLLGAWRTCKEDR